MLNLALFQAIYWSYHADAAGAVTKGGIWYGVGCLAAALVAIGAFYGYNVTITLALMAVAPLIFAGLYWRSTYTAPPAAAAEVQPRCGRLSRIFAAWARYCSRCCCSFNPETSGPWRDGCRYC